MYRTYFICRFRTWRLEAWGHHTQREYATASWKGRTLQCKTLTSWRCSSPKHLAATALLSLCFPLCSDFIAMRFK